MSLLQVSTQIQIANLEDDIIPAYPIATKINKILINLKIVIFHVTKFRDFNLLNIHRYAPTNTQNQRGLNSIDYNTAEAGIITLLQNRKNNFSNTGS